MGNLAQMPRRLTGNPVRADAGAGVGRMAVDLAAVMDQVRLQAGQIADLRGELREVRDALAHLREVLRKERKRATDRTRKLESVMMAERGEAQELVLHGGRLRELARQVGEARGITVPVILGRCRLGPVVMARQEVMYLAECEGLALSQIARAMGRDHSTIRSGIAAHKRRAGLE